MTGNIRKRENPGGSITWHIVLDYGTSADGKRKRECITIKGTKAEAKRMLNEKLNDFNKGSFVPHNKITTESYLLQFIESYCKANLKPTTLSGYTHNINRHIIPEIGLLQLQTLSPLIIQRLIDSLSAKGLGPRGVKYVHATLHKALEQAVRMQIIARNPSDHATLPKRPKARTTSYEEEEVQRMMDCASGTDLEIPLLLAVGLGVRRGELLSLRWEDVNLDIGQVTISRNLVYVEHEYIFSTPKSESGNRVVAIPGSMVPALKKYRKQQLENKMAQGAAYQDNGLVVCLPDGRPYKPACFSGKFNRFLRYHNLRVIRFHDLRHTNASLMLQYNVPIKVASQRLGHSTTAITMDIYAHVLGKLENEAAEKLDEGLFKKLGTRS